MDNLKVFDNVEFGAVRTAIVDNEPMFCLADVCKALDISHVSDVKSRLKEDGVGTTEVIDRLGRKQSATFINEGNLYKVIFQSRKESAERFTDWVTDEVLPSIRKTGGYNLPQTYTEALEHLLATTKENERLALENKEMKPKALFADAVSTSSTSILIGDLAKLICQNGVEIGQKRLFGWLRDKGYLVKYGDSMNMPMQRYIEQGLFEIKERTIQNPDGSVRITRTTKVTGKGQVYFVQKFLER